MECRNCGATLAGAPKDVSFPLCDLCYVLERQSARTTRHDAAHAGGTSIDNRQRTESAEPEDARPGRPTPWDPPQLREDSVHAQLLPHLELEQRRHRRRKRRAPVAWGILLLSIALFTCGATLIGWSLLYDNDLFWDVGVPITLAGQAGFFIGLILQLDVLGYQTRRLNRRLADMQIATQPGPTRRGRFSLPPRGPTTVGQDNFPADRTAPSRNHSARDSISPVLADLQSQLAGLQSQLHSPPENGSESAGR